MSPVIEFGECMISDDVSDYLFTPSFKNISSIGSPEEIVQTFYDLHSDKSNELFGRAIQAYGRVPDWLRTHASKPSFSKQAILSAMTTMQACCESDLSKLIGEITPSRSGKWAFVYKRGTMPVSEMILVAQSLITHGVIGKAKVRKLQRHENTTGTTSFNAFEYVNAARIHLGISKGEAERLTLTEFQLLLAAKYPDQKGFTREEYDKVADDYLAKKKRREARAKTQTKRYETGNTPAFAAEIARLDGVGDHYR